MEDNEMVKETAIGCLLFIEKTLEAIVALKGRGGNDEVIARIAQNLESFVSGTKSVYGIE